MISYFKISIAVVVAIVILAFVPHTQTYQTNVNASFLDIANQINYANNWKNWYMPFKKSFNTESTKYKINQNYEERKFSITADGKLIDVTFLSATLLEIKSDNDASTSVLLKAVFIKNDKCKLVQITKTSLLNYWWLSFTSKNTTANYAKSLKDYFETPILYYGFKIIKTGVDDTNFVTITKTALKKHTFKIADSLQKVLQAYANKNNFKFSEYPFLMINNKTTDSVMVTNMLVILDKRIDYNNEVNYLKMPKQGNMLIGYYKGKYRNRGLIYNSMDKYIEKNGLTRVVNTFEKFLDKKLPKNDSSVVDMALYYPIY